MAGLRCWWVQKASSGGVELDRGSPREIRASRGCVIVVVAFTLRFAVATALAVAAIAKARSFGAFRQTVQALTPWDRAVTPAAVAVVATEATLAVLLAAGVLATAVAAATLAYLGLLRSTEPSLSLGELPLAAALGGAAVLGGRWLLAAGELSRIVHQRRQLDKDLAEPARAVAR